MFRLVVPVETEVPIQLHTIVQFYVHGELRIGVITRIFEDCFHMETQYIDAYNNIRITTYTVPITEFVPSNYVMLHEYNRRLQRAIDLQQHLRTREMAVMVKGVRLIHKFHRKQGAKYYRQQAEEHYQTISHNPDYDIDL